MGTNLQTPAEVLSEMGLDLLAKRNDVIALFQRSQNNDVSGALADLDGIDRANLQNFHAKQEQAPLNDFGIPGTPYEEARREGNQISVLREYLKGLDKNA